MNMHKGILAERLIAKRYEEQGYAVTIEPEPHVIPFSLGGYHPDLLATKGKENLLVEVKIAGAKRDEQRYFRLAEEIERHQGWRFMLVTVPEDELQEQISSADDSSVLSIRANLRKIDQLLGHPDFAKFVVPHLWVAYIVALRQLVRREMGNVRDSSDFSLLNKAYSDGVISIEEYEQGRNFLHLRNLAVHSLTAEASADECKKFRRMIDQLLEKLDDSPSECP